MTKRKYPKVNIHNSELMFEKLVEQAINNPYIEKPISWALYKTWRWANSNEEVRKNDN